MTNENRHSLPLYVQVSETLIREVQAGRLLDGERLPPEREMAKNLGIAVGTLRKSLADLEAKGLLERIQGSGNYIRAQMDMPSVYSFFRVELLQGGGLPTAELISVEHLPKPDFLPEFGSADSAFRMRRLRKLNAIPAVLEEMWLDGSYAKAIAPEDLSESLYLYYREKLGLLITRAEDKLTTTDVPDWVVPEFGMTQGAPCLTAVRRSWSQDGTLAEVSYNWIDTNIATYVSRMK